MPESFVDRGEYLSLELLGTEYIDQTIEVYGDTLNYDGILLGLIIENISNETCNWDNDNIELVDANGFAYNIKYSDEFYHLDEILPGGWYAELDTLQPNRKYRYVLYIEDFHGELGRISYEANLVSLIHSTDPDSFQEKERVEIDISSSPTQDVEGLPELQEIFSEF